MTQAQSALSKPVVGSDILVSRHYLTGARAIAYDHTRDLAFIASAAYPGMPLTVIGLSMPPARRVVGAINGTQYDFMRVARGIAYDEARQIAYVSSASGLRQSESLSVAAVDVSDPVNPIVVGTLLAGMEILEDPKELVFDAASRHLFVVGESSASVVAVNVSNSKALTVTASLRDDRAMRGARGVVYDAARRLAFVASRDSHSLTSIDFSVMSSPKVLAVLHDANKLRRAEGVTCGENGHVLVASYGSPTIKQTRTSVRGSVALVDARDPSVLKIAALIQTTDTHSACAVVYDPVTRHALMPLEARDAVAVVAVSYDGTGSLKTVALLQSGMRFPRGIFLDRPGRRALVVSKVSGSLGQVSLPRQLNSNLLLTNTTRRLPDHANFMDKVRPIHHSASSSAV